MRLIRHRVDRLIIVSGDGCALALVGDQAYALVAYFRHCNNQDPVDVFDTHGLSVNMIGQGELTYERT
jgi:hypothetical protein